MKNTKIITVSLAAALAIGAITANGVLVSADAEKGTIKVAASPIPHAEILAIEKANKKLNAWRLENCEMYITLEPCMMCMGAIVNSRIKKIYIGALDPKTGSCKSVINMENYKFNHIVEVETGILQEDCEYILKDFFKMLRKMKRRKK